MASPTTRARLARALLILTVGLGTACRPTPELRRYQLRGQVLGVDRTRQEVLLKHESVEGLMPGMTMPFKVRNSVKLTDFEPGDLVTTTLEMVRDEAYLTEIHKTGTAPIEQPPPAPTASSGFELLKPGERVPDNVFIDQNGRARTLSALRGQAVALTFIYTRCPIPTFCPMLDRHFAKLAQSLTGSTIRKRVHLVSVTFDPEHDTPSVLDEHARSLGADSTDWSFLTGDRDAIDRFAARFGVTIVRGASPGDIAHNLRTAIIDADGKLVKIYTGIEWTPEQLLEDLKKVVE